MPLRTTGDPPGLVLFPLSTLFASSGTRPQVAFVVNGAAPATRGPRYAVPS